MLTRLTSRWPHTLINLPCPAALSPAASPGQATEDRASRAWADQPVTEQACGCMVSKAFGLGPPLPVSTATLPTLGGLLPFKR